LCSAYNVIILTTDTTHSTLQQDGNKGTA
jgi:hypothetical protein